MSLKIVLFSNWEFVSLSLSYFYTVCKIQWRYHRVDRNISLRIEPDLKSRTWIRIIPSFIATHARISPADHNKDILHILTANGGNNSVSAAQYSRFCRRNNIIGENASSFLVDKATHLRKCQPANFIGGRNLRRSRKRAFSVSDKRDGICSRKLRGNIGCSEVMRLFRHTRARRVINGTKRHLKYT